MRQQWKIYALIPILLGYLLTAWSPPAYGQRQVTSQAKNVDTVTDYRIALRAGVDEIAHLTAYYMDDDPRKYIRLRFRQGSRIRLPASSSKIHILSVTNGIWRCQQRELQTIFLVEVKR